MDRDIRNLSEKVEQMKKEQEKVLSELSKLYKLVDQVNDNLINHHNLVVNK